MALLIAAVVAVVAASAGPLYLNTAYGTVLQAKLAEASASSTAVDVGDLVTSSQAVALTSPALALGPRYGMGRWFGAAVVSYTAAVVASVRFPLVARPDVCPHLHFVSGHCPTAPGEIVLTSRSARVLGVRVGSVIHPYGPPGVGTLEVAGIILPGDPLAPYWLGQDFFGYGDGHLDSAFTVVATVAGLPTTALVQLPLDPRRVNPGNLGNLEGAVGAYEAAATQQLGLTATTGLFSAVNNYVSSADLMAVVVLLVDLQLVLLSLFVVYGLVAQSAEVRRRELAIARLRGLPRARTLAFGLGEPVLLLVAALPIGLLAAVGLTSLAQHALLPNSKVTIDPTAIAAGLAALAGGLLAVAAGSRRLLAAPLQPQLLALEPRPSALARAALDAAAVAVALAALVELVVAGAVDGRQPNPLSVLAPGLLAVAVAIACVRAVPVIARAVIRRTSTGPKVGLGIAVRQVVRRPSGLRQMAVLAVAVALAFFAVAGWAAAAANRVVRADFALGAARVLDVRLPAGVGLEQAVDYADPSGRYAMAAMVATTSGQNLLAVQASRLARVGYWPPGVSRAPLARLVRWLRPALQPPLEVSGTELRATVTLAGAPSPPPDLQLDLVDTQGNPQLADFGYLLPGTRTYEASLPAACLRGCWGTQLVPVWTPAQNSVATGQPASAGPTSAHYSITLATFQERSRGRWRAVTDRLGDASYWTSSGPGMGVRVASVDGRPSLQLSVHDSAADTTSPSVCAAALPPVLPGVMTRATSVQNPAAAPVTDFDGTAITVDAKYEVAALPQVGEDGFLMDLAAAVRAETGPPTSTQDQVWLSGQAPAQVIARLRQQGVTIVSSSSPARFLGILNRSGPALAFTFFLFAMGAAALLALGAAVFSAAATARRRAFEVAVLRAIGVSDRDLAWSLVAENLILLVPGVVAGVAAGLGGILLALPSVPEFTSSAGSPPVELVLVPIPIVVLVVSLTVILLVAAWVSARSTLRLASWARLRFEVG